MLARRSGVILNISSIIAMRGFSGLVGYAATKAGMIGMTQSLARTGWPQHPRQCDCTRLFGNGNVRILVARAAATNRASHAAGTTGAAPRTSCRGCDFCFRRMPRS